MRLRGTTSPGRSPVRRAPGAISATNAYGRSRTYRYYTCWTRNRYGVDHCDAPRLADALDAKVLEAIQDFYTNRLDEALDAIIASRSAHHQARAGYKTELAAVETQLAAKEEVVDRYLTEYEDNRIGVS